MSNLTLCGVVNRGLARRDLVVWRHIVISRPQPGNRLHTSLVRDVISRVEHISIEMIVEDVLPIVFEGHEIHVCMIKNVQNA